MGWERERKQETAAEDKTGKKGHICVIAKKLQWGQKGGAGWERHKSWYGWGYSVEISGQNTTSSSAGPATSRENGHSRYSSCNFILI